MSPWIGSTIESYFSAASITHVNRFVLSCCKETETRDDDHEMSSILMHNKYLPLGHVIASDDSSARSAGLTHPVHDLMFDNPDDLLVEQQSTGRIRYDEMARGIRGKSTHSRQ